MLINADLTPTSLDMPPGVNIDDGLKMLRPFGRIASNRMFVQRPATPVGQELVTRIKRLPPDAQAIWKRLLAQRMVVPAPQIPRAKCGCHPSQAWTAVTLDGSSSDPSKCPCGRLRISWVKLLGDDMLEKLQSLDISSLDCHADRDDLFRLRVLPIVELSEEVFIVDRYLGKNIATPRTYEAASWLLTRIWQAKPVRITIVSNDAGRQTAVDSLGAFMCTLPSSQAPAELMFWTTRDPLFKKVAHARMLGFNVPNNPVTMTIDKGIAVFETGTPTAFCPSQLLLDAGGYRDILNKLGFAEEDAALIS